MKHLPTLLLTLLSTAAIAGSYDDIIIQPSTYVNSQPAYVTQWNYIAPTPTAPSGLSLISSVGNGNYNVTASDGSMTMINSIGNGNYVITPANNQPMTLCNSISCFQ